MDDLHVFTYVDCLPSSEYGAIIHCAEKGLLKEYLELNDLDINTVVVQLNNYLNSYYKEMYSIIDLDEEL